MSEYTDNGDMVETLISAIKSANPTDSEIISLVRQVGTFQGMLIGMMHENPNARKTVQYMIDFYNKSKVA